MVRNAYLSVQLSVELTELIKTCKLLHDIFKLASDLYSTPLDCPINCYSPEELER